jgi:tetratricopeptide (TPR) repeat protein
VADGWRALQAGRLLTARRSFTDALEASPQDVRALEGLARVAAREGDAAEAIGHYEAALRHAPDTARMRVAVGMLLSDMREHGRAVEHLRQATELDAENAATWSAYAQALWRVEWYPQAATAYQRAITLDPSDAWSLVGLGDTHLRAGELDEAIAAYDKALEQDADAHAAHCGRGAALSKLGKFDAALASLRQAVTLRDDYGPAFYEMGVVLQHQKEYEDAIRAFGRATQLNGWDAPSVTNIARCYARLGKRDLARKAHEHAAKLQKAQSDHAIATAYTSQYPDLPDGYVGLGAVYARMGQNSEAIKAYKQALARAPRNVAAHFGLGDVYLNARMIAEAADIHRVLVTLRPGDIETRAMLGMLLRELGEEDESRTVLLTAHALSSARVTESGHANDWNLLAYVLYAQADYAAAESAMTEAIRLNPIESSYAGRLAQIRAARAAPR